MVLDLVVEGTGDRIDRVLSGLVFGLSRRKARDLIARGAVFVDGRRCRVVSRFVGPGSRLKVHWANALPPSTENEDLPPILFRDDEIIVVDKPAGIHTNETETTARRSLVSWMAEPVHLVHRLDRDTTGVIALARSTRVAARLSEDFKHRRVKKAYVALVEGTPTEGLIDRPIGPDRRRPRARAVREDGKEARTELVSVVSHGGFSEVHLCTETGRTHQIRVHLAHVGHPLLGDTLYGGPSAWRVAERSIRLGRTLLHAHRLELPGWAPFEAPLPADMVEMTRSWGT